ncbi:ribosomal protein S18-alanine N-acetyltransferase [Vagococcus fluvialis]|uniref:ribosomal protein S18-alanine N-acetyltransferase n=1 Tax=Vagococcus fluvialis TaxID=2738 RepID=UPI001A903D16|nr:ribosomal protein S18-alanine N-acetyltransferase [Vagococcus fluvialis]MBO0438521.1 ribosomal protein S18-alanine N-acetyltransferase [Vagococcus fluvialis]
MFKESDIRFDSAKVTDIYLLQETLKKVYGKSPWSYTIFWSEIIRKNVSVYLKTYYEESYIGFIGLRINGTDAHITSVAVLPRFQNLGAGWWMLKEAERVARSQELLTMSLEVKVSNKGAIHLYKKFGFYINGIKKAYYKENKEDAIDMTYVLEED